MCLIIMLCIVGVCCFIFWGDWVVYFYMVCSVNLDGWIDDVVVLGVDVERGD